MSGRWRNSRGKKDPQITVVVNGKVFRRAPMSEDEDSRSCGDGSSSSCSDDDSNSCGCSDCCSDEDETDSTSSSCYSTSSSSDSSSTSTSSSSSYSDSDTLDDEGAEKRTKTRRAIVSSKCAPSKCAPSKCAPSKSAPSKCAPSIAKRSSGAAAAKITRGVRKSFSTESCSLNGKAKCQSGNSNQCAGQAKTIKSASKSKSIGTAALKKKVVSSKASPVCRPSGKLVHSSRAAKLGRQTIAQRNFNVNSQTGKQTCPEKKTSGREAEVTRLPKKSSAGRASKDKVAASCQTQKKTKTKNGKDKCCCECTEATKTKKQDECMNREFCNGLFEKPGTCRSS